MPAARSELLARAVALLRSGSLEHLKFRFIAFLIFCQLFSTQPARVDDTPPASGTAHHSLQQSDLSPTVFYQ